MPEAPHQRSKNEGNQGENSKYPRGVVQNQTLGHFHNATLGDRQHTRSARSHRDDWMLGLSSALIIAVTFEGEYAHVHCWLCWKQRCIQVVWIFEGSI